MKKGRHRRFEEARALKEARVGGDLRLEPCAECEAAPGAPHASWCLAEQDDDDPDDEGEAGAGSGV